MAGLMRILVLVCLSTLFVLACQSEVAQDLVPPPATAPETLSVEVFDRLTGRTLPGARLRIGPQRSSMAGPLGIAELVLVPGMYDIEVSARGHLPSVLRRAAVEAGHPAELRLGLWPEAPDESSLRAHLSALETRRAQRDRPDEADLRPEARAILRGETLMPIPSDGDLADGDLGRSVAALEAPPTTVRIWRRSIDGASASCDGRIDVIPLEDYVKGVLPHEWIPSWHGESLRAGSLAIRTYVWNWVLSGGKYTCADLDDTTRSQVYRDETMAVTDAAVDATRGQGITLSGSLVSGEYGAEAGDPTADGVDDPHGSGLVRAGHGRGMCQWGSQDWALAGRDHTWIAEHYYPGAIVEDSEGPIVPALDASLVAEGWPAELRSGQIAAVWVDLRNEGLQTWDRLDTMLVADVDSPFYVSSDWVDVRRISDPDAISYATSSVGRFSFLVRAPEVSTRTVVEHGIHLEHGGVAFGPTINLSISIVAPGTSTDAGALDGGSVDGTPDGGTISLVDAGMLPVTDAGRTGGDGGQQGDADGFADGGSFIRQDAGARVGLVGGCALTPNTLSGPNALSGPSSQARPPLYVLLASCLLVVRRRKRTLPRPRR